MVVSFKMTLLSLSLLTALNVGAAINPQALSQANQNTIKNSAQLVNLNMKIKSKNQTLKSDLMMPFNQTAEFERKFGNNNVLIEMSPKHGKNPNEISLEMKFYKASGSKAFFKKEIIAKVNEESTVTFRGMSVRITPVIN